VPKRLRVYFLHDRRRLGLLSRLATRTLRAYVRATLERTSGGSSRISSDAGSRCGPGRGRTRRRPPG